MLALFQSKKKTPPKNNKNNPPQKKGKKEHFLMLTVYGIPIAGDPNHAKKNKIE